MHFNLLIFSFFLLTGVYASFRTEKLTLMGSITGGICAIIIFMASAFTGIVMLGSFFLLGTLATASGKKIKRSLGLEEEHPGRRDAFQVLANGGTAAICCFLIVILPQYYDILLLMVAASLASATSDTLSSELGNIYGKNFYNILSFKMDQRGLNGVISLEGCLFGLIGASIIAIIYAIGYNLWDIRVLIIIISGFSGNILDSILGATLERKLLIGNNLVNFLNTLFAALIAGFIYYGGYNLFS